MARARKQANLDPNNFSRAQSNQSDGEIKIGAYLEIARRRMWWLILSALSLFIVSTIFAQRLPDMYRAETVILVDSSQVLDKYVPTINTGDIAGRLTTLQQQVLSPTRLKKLVEWEGLYPDPSGKLTEEEVVNGVQKSIVVEAVNQGPGKTSTFRIAYSDRRRGKVAPIANHLAQMFIEENVKARVDQTEDTAEFLHDRMEDTKRQLDEKEAELRSIKARNILEMPESRPYHIEALANLRTQVQTIQDKIDQDRREKTVLQSVLMSGNSAPTVDVDGADGSSGANIYQTEIQKLEAKLSQLRARYGPQHPDVRKAQSDIEHLKTKATNETSTTEIRAETAGMSPNRRQRNPVLEAQIEKLKEDIQQQTGLLRPLQENMKYHEDKLAHMPAFEQQIARLQGDYDILKTQYTGLLEKEKAAEISHALEVRQKGEKFEVLDAAITPSKPSAPNRTLFSLAGLFGGLIAGIALAALAEINDESVRSEDEAGRLLDRPVLSGIPCIFSAEERRMRLRRVTWMVAATVAGSTIFGFLLSFASGRLL